MSKEADLSKSGRPTPRGLGEALRSVQRHNTGGAHLLNLPLSQIEEDPHNARTSFDEAALAELADSIREHGIIEPLVVVELAPKRYGLVAGARRLRAARTLGLETVPALRRDELPHRQRTQLVENIQREDLSPLEVAHALQRELSVPGAPNKTELARSLGKKPAWVSQHLRLLTLPEDVQGLLRDGLVTGYNRLIALDELKGPTRTVAIAGVRNGIPVQTVLEAAAEPDASGQRATPPSGGNARSGGTAAQGRAAGSTSSTGGSRSRSTDLPASASRALTIELTPEFDQACRKSGQTAHEVIHSFVACVAGGDTDLLSRVTSKHSG